MICDKPGSLGLTAIIRAMEAVSALAPHPNGGYISGRARVMGRAVQQQPHSALRPGWWVSPRPDRRCDHWPVHCLSIRSPTGCSGVETATTRRPRQPPRPPRPQSPRPPAPPPPSTAWPPAPARLAGPLFFLAPPTPAWGPRDRRNGFPYANHHLHTLHTHTHTHLHPRSAA
jgi:hypothetical protein